MSESHTQTHNLLSLANVLSTLADTCFFLVAGYRFVLRKMSAWQANGLAILCQSNRLEAFVFSILKQCQNALFKSFAKNICYSLRDYLLISLGSLKSPWVYLIAGDEKHSARRSKFENFCTGFSNCVGFVMYLRNFLNAYRGYCAIFLCSIFSVLHTYFQSRTQLTSLMK